MNPIGITSWIWTSPLTTDRFAEIAPHVARLTIDNPEKRNALDHAILDGITQVARELDDARCLILTAEGPVFSAGYDIGGLPRDRFAHQLHRQRAAAWPEPE